MRKLILTLSLLAILCGGWGGYTVFSSFSAARAEVQGFLNENKGVVKVSKVFWTPDKGWQYEVTSFSGGKVFPAYPIRGANPNPGEFWRAKVQIAHIALIGQTKCP